MLVGKDLGLPNLVVLVLVFGVFPAIGFVIRRKWRHAAARREEIKRLLVLASEEAVRAEIEAAEGYFYTANTSSSFPTPDSVWVQPTASVPLVSSLKPPYQCAVCFSPTNTRCAKCKAVRYCSGRCQIVHWRQGHKDECRPYVAVKPARDVSGSSQGDDEVFSEVLHHKDDAGVQSHAHQPETDSVFQSTSESSSEENSTFSIPSRSSEASSGSSGDSDRMDTHPSADVIISDNSVTVKSKHQTLASPARKSTSSGNISRNKSHFNDENTLPDDGSRKSAYSDPSATSSGFWSGMTHSKKSTIDELDGFERSSSNDVANMNIIDSQSPFGLSSKVAKNGYVNTSVKGVAVTSTTSDDSAPNDLGSKKSNDDLASSRPKKYTSEMLKHRDLVADSDLTQSMLKETKLSPSGVGEDSRLKDSKAFRGIPFAIPESSSRAFNNKSIVPPANKSVRVVDSSLSKASDIHVTSSSSRVASQSRKPVMAIDEKNTVATCSSKLTENIGSARNGLKTSMLKVADQLKPSKLPRHCSPSAEIDTSHRYSCKGLFSYEMFVKLYNWKQVELQPFGLINCGNSCYANAVLQCLTYTPPLNAYLLQGFHSKACDKRDWCFTCEFEGLVLKAKNGNSPLSPMRMLSRIENIGSNLGHGREEDAHEFLRYAIDTWQSVCLKEAKTKASNSLEEETTLIGLTFGGYLRSKIKCMKCGGKSEQHERMMDLTVEIEGNIGTLEEALDKFTCTEILDGENKYKCSRCKSYEKAKKRLTLLEAPNVLTIALKRFQSGKYGKLNKSIHFPEILDMAPYVSGTSDKSPVYSLYGVVVHLDVMNATFSGHYVCYVKNVENRWFKIDDSRVKEVDLQSVLTKGAYMLLYARCSPRAPRLIRSLLSRHHHDPKTHKAATPFGSRSQSTEPWDITSQPPIRYRSLEEESSSSSDGSGIFSESCSCSTESSHRDSSSIEDHIAWDWEQDYNSSSPPWRNMNMHMNSSDSDTSSSSSSFPSPLYSTHHPLYADNKTTRERSRSCKEGCGVLNNECRNRSCRSSSCREANVDRLGGRPTNLSESSKPTVRRGKSD